MKYRVTVAADVPLYRNLIVEAESEQQATGKVQQRLDRDLENDAEVSNDSVSRAIGESGESSNGWRIGYPDEIELKIVYVASETHASPRE